LVAKYIERSLDEAHLCFYWEKEDGQQVDLMFKYVKAIDAIQDSMKPFFDSCDKETRHLPIIQDFKTVSQDFKTDIEEFKNANTDRERWKKVKITLGIINETTKHLTPLVGMTRDLTKKADKLYNLVNRLNELRATESDLWGKRDILQARKLADEARQEIIDQLKKVRYFHRQALWLTERFPDGKLQDIEGLVKLVDSSELEKNNWSLTPGLYVGVAPEEEDEGFDFEETLRNIHIELEDLDTDASRLAAEIKKNFKGLGI